MKKSYKSCIQKADIFGIPFSFTYHPDKNISHTFCGGILSILIYLIGIWYYIYLCFLYYGNNFQPTTSYLQKQQTTQFSMEFERNFVTFQIILSDNTNLIDYERSSGKILLNKFVELFFTNDDGQQKLRLKLEQCLEHTINDRYCVGFFDLNSSQYNSQITMKYNPSNLIQDKMIINLSYCTQIDMDIGQVCETDDKVRQSLLGLSSYMEVQIKMKQFEPKTKTLSSYYRSEQFFFDYELAFFSKMTVKKCDTEIITGFVFQSINQITYFSDYIRVDQFVSKSTLQGSSNYSQLTKGIVQLHLGQNSDYLNIQYILYPELLAQFFGLFKVLLLFGYLSKYVAKSDMFQEFISLYLKTYYKMTAIELIQKQSPHQKPFESIYSLFTYIQRVDFRSNLAYYFNLDFYKKITLNQFKKPKQRIETKESKILNFLVEKSKKCLDIFEIQKDIIQMKMMMKLLLSVDQYAAIQLCGTKVSVETFASPSSSFQEKFDYSQKYLREQQMIPERSPETQIQKIEMQNMSIDQDTSKQVQFSAIQSEDIILKQKTEEVQIRGYTHLEKIDLLEQDESYFQQNIDAFIMKTQNYTDIDARIQECMLSQSDLN